MWVVIKEKGNFIPMGIGVMIPSTKLQLHVKSIIFKKKVDTK
jgi:hypothetical protein